MKTSHGIYITYKAILYMQALVTSLDIISLAIQYYYTVHMFIPILSKSTTQALYCHSDVWLVYTPLSTFKLDRVFAMHGCMVNSVSKL